MKEYKVKFRYKKTTEWSDDGFYVDVNYKIAGMKRGVKTTLKCYIDRSPAVEEGEINPLMGVACENLTDEMKKEIIKEAVKESAMVEILRRINKKWSQWEEIVVLVDNERGI